mmetsp:Transcript_115078/g.187491  ORF Transcript_115078/g.187491 Transcript_115078/m.187491 type:complete len:85 (-) Transcript_115078:171-425(-)
MSSTSLLERNDSLDLEDVIGIDPRYPPLTSSSPDHPLRLYPPPNLDLPLRSYPSSNPEYPPRIPSRDASESLEVGAPTCPDSPA